MNRDANTPKKAERPICKWLNLIGVKDVRHVGNEGHGPPDFIGRYHGKVVAVESVLLPTKPKKAVTRNERIKELVREMVEDPDAEDHIHQVCFEYDCELPEKHLRFDAWRDGAIKALRYGMSGEWYQILPEGKRMGTRGIKIGIVSGGIPTKNLVVSVQENMGERIDAKAMTDSIQNVVSIVRDIVPPISLDSIVANVPGSQGEEALNVWEIGRAGPGERKAGRPAEAVERAAEDRDGVTAVARGGHGRGEPGGSGRAAGAGAVATGVPGRRPAGPEGEELGGRGADANPGEAERSGRDPATRRRGTSE